MGEAGVLRLAETADRAEWVKEFPAGSLRSLDSPFGFAQGRRGGCPHVGILRSTRSVYAGADDFRENEAAVVPNESSVISEILPRDMTQ